MRHGFDQCANYQEKYGGPCICNEVKRKLDGLLYDLTIDLVSDKMEEEPEEVVMPKPVVIINPDDVLNACAKSKDVLEVADFHEIAVNELLKTHDGADPAFGNMAAELAGRISEEASSQARKNDTRDTVSLGGFGSKPVHVPVKIPPKKRRPVRDSDLTGRSNSGDGSLGDVISGLLDDIFG